MPSYHDDHGQDPNDQDKSCQSACVRQNRSTGSQLVGPLCDSDRPTIEASCSTDRASDNYNQYKLVDYNYSGGATSTTKKTCAVRQHNQGALDHISIVRQETKVDTGSYGNIEKISMFEFGDELECRFI